MKTCLTQFLCKTVRKSRRSSPWLFNFATVHAARKVKTLQEGMKLNATHQHMICADGINLGGTNVHTANENIELSLVASKETGL